MVKHVMPEAIFQLGEVLNSPYSITNYDARTVNLAMHVPMHLSFGTYTSRPSGWLQLKSETERGEQVGYGEGATLPEPVFTDDSGRNIAENIHEVVRSLQAKQSPTLAEGIEYVKSYRFADGGRYPTARLAVEMALMDIATKDRGISVNDAIGIPKTITEVPYGKSIGGETEASILRQVDVALTQSAKKIKIKVSPDIFSEVITSIKTIQAAYPEISIMVDANGGFDPTKIDHLDMVRELDDLGLTMIEEPVSRIGIHKDLSAVRRLRDRLPNLQTRLCLDDCLHDLAICRKSIDEGLADILNVKPGRIGTFIGSLALVGYAADKHVEIMVGGMFEATPGRCMTTSLAAFCLARGFTIPGDISLAQERLSEDLVSPDRQLHLTPSGAIALPRGKGWGF